MSKAKSRDKAPWHLPHFIFLLPSLPPFLLSLLPCHLPRSSRDLPHLWREPWPHFSPGMGSIHPLHSLLWPCLLLLPDSSHPSNGPSMLEPSDLGAGHSLSLARSSPTRPHGSLLRRLQVSTHLPPVFTPTHTSYPPFPLFLLSMYHKHTFCTEYQLQENKDCFKCLYP